MASPPTSVLLRMLEPWFDRARDYMALSVDTFVTPVELARGFWLNWSLPDDGAITIEDVEAMELLELLVRVDFHAGWKTLLEITNNTVYLDHLVDAATLSSSPLLPKFEIVSLHEAFIHSTFEKVLQWLFFGVNPQEHSPAYYAVRQTLLRSCADRHHQGRIASVTRDTKDQIPIKFDLNLMELDSKSAEKLLKKVVEVATLLKHPERLELYTSWRHASGSSISSLSDVFSFDAVDVVFGSVLTSTYVLDLVQRLRDQWDVKVETIDLDSAARELPSEAMVPFFRTMLAPETTENGKTPEEIALGFDAGLWQFCAATSALQITSNVRKIIISGSNDVEEIPSRDIRCWWAWIAYALFSVEASPTVQAADLDMNDLTLEDVLVFEQVLEMRDPLVYIASCLDGSLELRAPELATQAPTVVEVFPRSTLLTGDERSEIYTKNEVETLRVIADSPDKQLVRAVYPGAGVCWVHRSQIIQQREFCVPSASTSGIHSLHIDLTDSTDLVALTRLLKSIGRGLTRLDLVGDVEAVLDDTFFSQVFAACPPLRRLDLVDVKVTSFEWLGMGGSRLQTLSLSDVKPQQPDSYKRMFAIIGAASGSLVDLHIQLFVEELEPLMDDIERMLDLNSAIERVLLSANGSEPDDELVTALDKRLSKQSGKLLAVRRAALPIKSKLAFLSVISHGRVYSTELATVLIAMIFEFAAPCKQRVCGFVASVAVDEDDEDEDDEDDDQL